MSGIYGFSIVLVLYFFVAFLSIGVFPVKSSMMLQVLKGSETWDKLGLNYRNEITGQDNSQFCDCVHV